VNKSNEPELIRAAGGLLWRESDHGKEIMIIHRTKYCDWSLPKGKLKTGERWEEAALREVAEETGYSTTLENFAGTTFYYHKGRPKIVLFWNMRVKGTAHTITTQPDSPTEVDQRTWLPVPEAIKRMDYVDEIELVSNEADRS